MEYLKPVFNIFIKLILYVTVCCGSQGTTWGGQFFPSTMCAPGNELRSSAWRQVPLPAEPSHQPLIFVCKMRVSSPSGWMPLRRNEMSDRIIFQKNQKINNECVIIYLYSGLSCGQPFLPQRECKNLLVLQTHSASTVL